MEARELRIGNYIRYKGTIIPVTAVYVGQPTLKDAEPITLTPEILEAAGFEYSKGETTCMVWYSLKSISLLQINESEYKVVSGSDIRIKYLHQLQNLYFALTGEELTVNLKETKEAVLIWNHLAQITTGL